MPGKNDKKRSNQKSGRHSNVKNKDLARPDIKHDEIRCDELTNAIVKAHRTIEEEKTKQADEELKKWRELLGIEEFSHHPIKQFFSEAKSIGRMLVIKREKINTLRATYSLIKILMMLSLVVIKWFLYVLVVTEIIRAVGYGVRNDWVRMISAFLYGISAIIAAGFLRIVGIEVENMRNRVEILSISSTLAAISASLAAIATLVVEVLLKCGR